MSAAEASSRSLAYQSATESTSTVPWEWRCVCCVNTDTPYEEQTCTTPASRGHLKCLKKAFVKRLRRSSNAAAAAARGDHYACLTYLLSHYFRVSRTALLEAAMHDYLECLELMCQRRDFPFRNSEDICAFACQGGSLRCLQYLFENGYCLHAVCQIAAASGGNLECMQFLLSHSCPWDVQVMYAAAQSGNLACLCFAFENGCPWWDHEEVEPIGITSPQCLLFIVQHCPTPAIAYLSAQTFGLLQAILSKRAASIWCMTPHAMPMAVQQVILQYADLLCAVSCPARAL